MVFLWRLPNFSTSYTAVAAVREYDTAVAVSNMNKNSLSSHTSKEEPLYISFSDNKIEPLFTKPDRSLLESLLLMTETILHGLVSCF